MDLTPFHYSHMDARLTSPICSNWTALKTNTAAQNWSCPLLIAPHYVVALQLQRYSILHFPRKWLLLLISVGECCSKKLHHLVQKCKKRKLQSNGVASPFTNKHFLSKDEVEKQLQKERQAQLLGKVFINKLLIRIISSWCLHYSPFRWYEIKEQHWDL